MSSYIENEEWFTLISWISATVSTSLFTDFLLADCRQTGVRPSVRLVVDKIIPDFLQWQAEESESHWHDLVHAGVLESVIVPKEELRDMSRQD